MTAMMAIACRVRMPAGNGAYLPVTASADEATA